MINENNPHSVILGLETMTMEILENGQMSGHPLKKETVILQKRFENAILANHFVIDLKEKIKELMK